MTGAATTVTAQVDSLVEQVDSTVDEAVKSVDEVLKLDGSAGASGNSAAGVGGSVPSFTMLRPEIKFGCIVGATALLSARFGPRAFVRNTAIMAGVGGYVAYPSFWDKAKESFLGQVEKVSGTKR